MKKSTNNSSKPKHLPRRVFNSMDDISEFENEINRDGLSDEQVEELLGHNPHVGTTLKERSNYQRKLIDAGKQSMKDAPKEFAHLAEQYHSGKRNDLRIELPPILFKQVGTTPMSVPYLKVFVSASVGQEDVLHSLYTLAR